MTALSVPCSAQAIKTPLVAGEEKSNVTIGKSLNRDSVIKQPSKSSHQPILRLLESRAAFTSVLLGNSSSDQTVFNGSSTTRNGLQLVESEFGVGHWF